MKKPKDDKDVKDRSQQEHSAVCSLAEMSVPPQTINGTTAQRGLTFGDIFKYVKRVEKTLKDKFAEFIRVMEDRVAKRIDTAYMVGRLKEIFKGHPHLILGYNNIVAKEYQIPPEDAPKLINRLNPNDGDVIFRNIQVLEFEKGGRDERVWRDKKCVRRKRSGATKSSQEVVGQKSIRELDLSNSKRCTPSYQLLPKNHTLPSVSWRTDDDAKVLNDPNDGDTILRNIQGRRDDRVWRDKNCVQQKRTGATKSSQEVVGQKSIRELDLSNSKRCTPSYQLLPKNYTLPSVSWRTDDDAKVLNDHCILVTSGSENFKRRQTNQYEKKLFRCEDDRFELDMLLELFNSTRLRVQQLLTKIINNDIDTDHPLHIEDYLTAQNMRCIEKLYRHRGLNFMDELHKDPPGVLWSILPHLKQKQEELESSRSVFDKACSEILAKNYHKSLDHRSCNFKQKDKWSLSTKALVAEIKKICVKKKELQAEGVESIVPRTRQPIIPRMEFEFRDADIHEDIYRLVKYSCEKSCSSKQADKVMKIWTTFLEPALGLSRRPQGAGNTGNRVKHKKTCNSVGEFDSSSGGPAITNQNISEISGSGPAAAHVQLLDVSDESGLVENLSDDLQEPEKDADPGENEKMALSTSEDKGRVHDYEGYGGQIPSSDCYLQAARPLDEHTPLELHDLDKNGLIFYGNDSFYVLFRLHQVLYGRIQKVKSYSSSTENGLRVSSDTNPTDSYGRLMGAIYRLLDGTSDNATFEDDCRSIIGTQSYLLCTLKNLIDKVVGQLRKISTDEVEMRLIECHEESRNPASFADEVYSANARFMLPGNNIYRIECVPHSSTPARLTIQLMDYVQNEGKEGDFLQTRLR